MGNYAISRKALPLKEKVFMACSSPICSILERAELSITSFATDDDWAYISFYQHMAYLKIRLRLARTRLGFSCLYLCGRSLRMSSC